MRSFKSILLVCICCFVAVISSAQDKFEYYKINRIKVAPIRFLYHPFEPGLELSYERVFRPHWSYEVTGNRIYALMTDTSLYNKKGWAFGSEIRYHFNSIKFDHCYLSFGGAFAYSKAEASLYFRPDKLPGDSAVGFPFDSLDYKDDFMVYRNTSFISMRFGKIFDRDRFHFEISCGISLIYRNHRQTGRLFPEDRLAFRDARKATFRGLDSGVGWLFRLPFQFRVCYAFGEKYAIRRPEEGY